jgi:hypothetical protein
MEKKIEADDEIQRYFVTLELDAVYDMVNDRGEVKLVRPVIKVTSTEFLFDATIDYEGDSAAPEYVMEENMVFAAEMTRSLFSKATIKITVYDLATFLEDDFLGEVVINCAQVNASPNHEIFESPADIRGGSGVGKLAYECCVFSVVDMAKGFTARSLVNNVLDASKINATKSNAATSGEKSSDPPAISIPLQITAVAQAEEEEDDEEEDDEEDEEDEDTRWFFCVLTLHGLNNLHSSSSDSPVSPSIRVVAPFANFENFIEWSGTTPIRSSLLEKTFVFDGLLSSSEYPVAAVNVTVEDSSSSIFSTDILGSVSLKVPQVHRMPNHEVFLGAFDLIATTGFVCGQLTLSISIFCTEDLTNGLSPRMLKYSVPAVTATIQSTTAASAPTVPGEVKSKESAPQTAPISSSKTDSGTEVTISSGSAETVVSISHQSVGNITPAGLLWFLGHLDLVTSVSGQPEMQLFRHLHPRDNGFLYSERLGNDVANPTCAVASGSIFRCSSWLAQKHFLNFGGLVYDLYFQPPEGKSLGLGTRAHGINKFCEDAKLGFGNFGYVILGPRGEVLGRCDLFFQVGTEPQTMIFQSRFSIHVGAFPNAMIQDWSTYQIEQVKRLGVIVEAAYASR